jgi:hypothetical protein
MMRFSWLYPMTSVPQGKNDQNYDFYLIVLQVSLNKGGEVC